MGRKCVVYNCRGNYRGEPYSEVVKIPEDVEIKTSWISALPNANSEELKGRKSIFICKRHFDPDCEWVKTQAGSRPNEPPCIFEGVPKSCLKQTKSKPRKTKLSTSSARANINEQK